MWLQCVVVHVTFESLSLFSCCGKQQQSVKHVWLFSSFAFLSNFLFLFNQVSLSSIHWRFHHLCRGSSKPLWKDRQSRRFCVFCVFVIVKATELTTTERELVSLDCLCLASTRTTDRLCMLRMLNISRYYGSVSLLDNSLYFNRFSICLSFRPLSGRWSFLALCNRMCQNLTWFTPSQQWWD